MEGIGSSGAKKTLREMLGKTEGRQKDKTIDELLNANAGGVTDSSSLRRTQQQHTGALKARVGELETMLLEKEAALQQATNQPEAQTLVLDGSASSRSRASLAE